MPLTAVLGEIRAPVARLARLAPGDVLPLAISGQARLRVGGIEIARGQIGATDGQLALRLTHIAWTEKRHGHDG
nr:FliM/FliN family flagellar motor C-terminal domain-containing protein [Parerythrobacter lacustris]